MEEICAYKNHRASKGEIEEWEREREERERELAYRINWKFENSKIAFSMFLDFQRVIYAIHSIKPSQTTSALVFPTFIYAIAMALSAPKVTKLPSKLLLN